MELIYYWIDQFNGNLEKLGINFGGEYNLKYCIENKTLEINKNQDYIEHFFNKNNNKEIINITGIVGENGSGKSSILDAIKGIFRDGGIACLQDNDIYEFYRTIICIKYDNKLILFVNDELIYEKENIINNCDIDIDIHFYGINHIDEAEKYDIINTNYRKLVKVVNKSDMIQNVTCIYMNNIFDMSTPIYNSNKKSTYYDISTNGIIDELEKGKISIHNRQNEIPIFIDEDLGSISNKLNIPISRRVRLYQLLQQLKYITDDIENYNSINKFKLPEKIIISTDFMYEGSKHEGNKLFTKNERSLLRYQNKDTQNKLERYIYNYLENCIKGCNEEDKKQKFISYKSFMIRVIDSYFNDIYRALGYHDTYLKKLKNDIESIDNNLLEDKFILDLMDLMKDKMISNREVYTNNKDNLALVKKDIDRINKIHKAYSSFIKSLEYFIFDKNTKVRENFNHMNIKSNNIYNSIYEKSGDLMIDLNEENLGKIKKFIYEYIELGALQDFLVFSWRNISSGEYALLDTYSKFYSLKNKELKENIFIIIDEGELYLHPEWQRQYISILIEYLPRIYKNKNIQIVFASNSPFLISDIPRTNIIALKTDNNKIKLSDSSLTKQTFGANISKLLGDTFFMKNTMGTFSRYKIDNVLDILKKEDVELDKREYVKKVIDLIEEPIIKIKLKEIYNDKYGNVEDEIKYIDENIEKLIEKKKKLQSKTNQNNGEVNDKN